MAEKMKCPMMKQRKINNGDGINKKIIEKGRTINQKKSSVPAQKKK